MMVSKDFIGITQTLLMEVDPEKLEQLISRYADEGLVDTDYLRRLRMNINQARLAGEDPHLLEALLNEIEATVGSLPQMSPDLKAFYSERIREVLDPPEGNEAKATFKPDFDKVGVLLDRLHKEGLLTWQFAELFRMSANEFRYDYVYEGLMRLLKDRMDEPPGE